MPGWCGKAIESSFGPAVRGCRSGFDFTLFFEQLILSIIPSIVFLVVLIPRVYRLYGNSPKARAGWLLPAKIIAGTLYTAVQIFLLVRWDGSAPLRIRTSTPAATLTVIDGLGILLLSPLEHCRSLRPSTILQIYLLFTLSFDIAICRTLWLIRLDSTMALAQTLGIAMKSAMFCLEVLEKRAWLQPKYLNLKPETIGGVVNLSVFWWLNKLFLTGRGKILTLADLDEIEEKHRSKALERNLKANWARASRDRPHALLYTIAYTLRWSLAASILPRLISIGFKFSQPFLIAALIEFLDSPDIAMDSGYGMIGAYALTYSGVAITLGFYWYKTFRTITMVRGSLIAIIYSRTLELGLSSPSQSAPSALMSNDVERICTCLVNLHELWASVIEVCIAVYILERQIGMACISPALLAVACGFGTFFLTSRIGKRQEAWLKAVQRRLKSTEYILGSIKEIKMMGLTEKLAKVVQDMRVQELLLAMSYRRLQVTSIVISLVMNVTGAAVTFTTFTIIAAIKGNGTLLAGPAFASITILVLIGTPLITLFQALPLLRSAVGSLTRIEDFLNQTGHEDSRHHETSSPDFPSNLPLPSGQKSDREFPMVAVNKALFHGEQCSTRELVTIADGSIGWTNTEQIVLRNINLLIKENTLTMIIGPIGSGKSTLLKAILGEAKLFGGFIKVAAGDVSFCDQSPWLIYATIRRNITGIDDLPFDEEWYKTVIHACALEKDLASLSRGDQTIIGSKGAALSGGQRQRLSIARALYSRKRLAIFDDVLCGLDMITEEQVFTRVFGPEGILRQQRITSTLVTHRVKRLQSANHIVVIGDSGRFTQQGKFKELLNEAGYVRNLVLNGDANEAKSRNDIENEDHGIRKVAASPTADGHDDISRKAGDFSVYKYYLRFVGSGTLYMALGALVVYSFCLAFPTIWLDKWASANKKHPGDNSGLYLAIYIMLGILGLAALLLFCWQMIVVMAPRAGRELHSIVLQHAFWAPLTYLTQIDMGIIMNRFSQDMQLIDFQVTLASMSAAEALSTTIMRLIIVCLTAKYIASILPVTLAVVYFIQKMYLQTSRQLRHLDLEAKAPIYSLFIETLEGLPTIRAFGWQGHLRQRNHELLDAAQKPFYLLHCIQTWLQFVLDMLLTVVSVLVVTFAVKFRGQTSGGGTAVALVNVLTCHQHLAGFIQRWTLLETSIGAVSRVRAFSIQCPVETRQDLVQIPSEWRPRGEIRFQNVTASYSPSAPVLQDVTFLIPAGSRIGVCGRTGSGKSSFILCLLQMLDISNGKISIDELDTSQCSREVVRSAFTTVPQDGVLFEGSIRFNIDPRGSSNISDIETALRKAQLWDIIHQDGDLDSPIDSLHLSHGQRQLFSLARAMLSKANILILDEAVSSVDQETNSLMQSLIRSEFADRTVICVEHHLENILDYDKIAVFDGGRLVEYDEPERLLQSKSRLKELVEG